MWIIKSQIVLPIGVEIFTKLIFQQNEVEKADGRKLFCSSVFCLETMRKIETKSGVRRKHPKEYSKKSQLIKRCSYYYAFIC